MEAAITAHRGVALSPAEATQLASYVRQIGREEATAPVSTAVPTGTGLLAQYFPNATLGGAAVLSRNEAVNFNWGTASPGAGVPADGFSVRWTGKLQPLTSGQYVFRTQSDDGVRLWIDGVLVVDNWVEHSLAVDLTQAIPLTAGRAYDVRLEYFERSGGAVMRLEWYAPGTNGYVAVPMNLLYPAAAPPPPVVGAGLSGSYFANVTLAGAPVLTRLETPDFNWLRAAPAVGLPVDNFSVRWTGFVQAPTTGSYRLQTQSDDGVRVWFNNVLVIDNWTDHALTANFSQQLGLVEGQRYPIVVEYYDRALDAQMRLSWRLPNATLYTPIPPSQLYAR